MAWARHSSVHPSSFSKSLSAKLEYLSRSTSPSSRNDLHAAHWPSLQPCMSISPWRKAPRRTVSSSSTSNSIPTGSRRTWNVSPMASGPRMPRRRPAVVFRPIASLSTGSGGLLGRLGGPAAGRAASLVLGDVGLALLRRHLVEEDVGALEGVALHVVQRPHLLGIQVEMRLRDERVAVVADVAEVLDDLSEILAVVHGLPLAMAGELAHRRGGAAVVLGTEGHRVGPVAGR